MQGAVKAAGLKANLCGAIQLEGTSGLDELKAKTLGRWRFNDRAAGFSPR